MDRLQFVACADWDRLPLGRYMYLIQEIRGFTHQRHAFAGLCYVFLRGALDPENALAKPVQTRGSRGIVPPIAPKQACGRK